MNPPPEPSYALLFPGQGSQHVGMGEGLFEIMPDLLGDAADAVLGWSLAEMCLEGPEDSLTRTEHAQPALYAVSYALWRSLAEELPRPAASAGHSLGEYTALAASGAIGYFDGLRLVAERGKAMAAAADEADSGMAALIGGDPGGAEDLAAKRRGEGGDLWVANVNAPGQVVVAGGRADIDWAAEHGSDHGIRRVVPLNVGGAFHSPLMRPAADRLGGALEEIAWAPAAFPVWANSTALPYGEDVAGTLLGQLTSTVRFAETLSSIGAGGVTRFLHVGPGDVTAGLARRSVESAETVVVSSLDDVPAAVTALGGGNPSS